MATESKMPRCLLALTETECKEFRSCIIQMFSFLLVVMEMLC